MALKIRSAILKLALFASFAAMSGCSECSGCYNADNELNFKSIKRESEITASNTYRNSLLQFSFTNNQRSLINTGAIWF